MDPNYRPIEEVEPLKLNEEELLNAFREETQYEQKPSKRRPLSKRFKGRDEEMPEGYPNKFLTDEEIKEGNPFKRTPDLTELETFSPWGLVKRWFFNELPDWGLEKMEKENLEDMQEQILLRSKSIARRTELLNKRLDPHVEDIDEAFGDEDEPQEAYWARLPEVESWRDLFSARIQKLPLVGRKVLDTVLVKEQQKGPQEVQNFFGNKIENAGRFIDKLVGVADDLTEFPVDEIKKLSPEERQEWDIARALYLKSSPFTFEENDKFNVRRTEFASFAEHGRDHPLPPLIENQHFHHRNTFFKPTDIWGFTAFPILLSFFFFFLPSYAIYASTRLMYRLKGNFAPIGGFSSGYKKKSHRRRARVIWRKKFKRLMRRRKFKILSRILFFPIYSMVVVPLHKYLPTEEFPPMLDNMAHSGWVGFVVGAYLGYFKGAIFAMGSVGAGASILLGLTRSTDHFNWYRLKLLEKRAEITGVHLSELLDKYPIFQRSPVGYYVDKKTHKPVNAEDLAHPYLRTGKVVMDAKEQDKKRGGNSNNTEDDDLLD